MLHETAAPDILAEPDSAIKMKQAIAAYRLAMEYPADEASVAPTRLGNVLLNPASYAKHQYGAHLDTIWPIMSLALKKDDEELFGKVSESSGRYTFLAIVTVLLLVVAVELLLVGLVVGQPRPYILGTVLLAILAYQVYLATCKEATGWAIHMRTALDTHLDAVADKLKLRKLPLENFSERKKRWETVSQWLAYGGFTFQSEADSTPYYETPPPKKDWYVAPVTGDPGFEVVAPPTVKVETKRLLQRSAIPDPDHPETKWVFGTVATYMHLITNTEAENPRRTARGVYLSVTDSQLAPDQTIQGKLLPGNQVLTTRGLLAGEDPTVIWNIGNIPSNSTFVLDYRVVYSDALEVEVKSADNSGCMVAITKVEIIRHKLR